MGYVPSFQVLKLFRVVHFKKISMAFRCPVLAPDTASVNGFCIILVLVPVPAPVPETASVNTPLVGHQPRKVGTGGLELSPLRKKKQESRKNWSKGVLSVSPINSPMGKLPLNVQVNLVDGLFTLPNTDSDPNAGTDIHGYCSDWGSKLG